jgi:hypothetical protein
MLLVNKRIDVIDFHDRTFHADWGALVVPKLECNGYRKPFRALQKIEVPSTRAAIIARALGHARMKPSLVWITLSQNHGILCSYLGDSWTCGVSVSVSSRKRLRSPSRMLWVLTESRVAVTALMDDIIELRYSSIQTRSCSRKEWALEARDCAAAKEEIIMYNEL